MRKRAFLGEGAGSAAQALREGRGPAGSAFPGLLPVPLLNLELAFQDKDTAAVPPPMPAEIEEAKAFFWVLEILLLCSSSLCF